jgi:hypothetical protein
MPPVGRVYDASAIEHRRATQDEMETLADFLITYASEHGPVSVRGLQYQAEVALILGIEKDEKGICKGPAAGAPAPPQRPASVPQHRRRDAVADQAQDLRQPPRLSGRGGAALPPQPLARSPHRVEIWLDKEALAGVVAPITCEMDVPLMVTRGHCSESFAWNSVQQYAATVLEVYVYSFYDFDQSGQSASLALQETLERFAAEAEVEIIYVPMMLDDDKVETMRLPTRPHKRATAADKDWPYDFSCELDAVPPDDLRRYVRACIEGHLSAEEIAFLKDQEARKRELIRASQLGTA